MAEQDDRWVVLTSDLNAVRLEMWRELLEAEGIPAQLPGLRHGQAFGGALGGTGIGVEVRVRASDAERARELLESLETVKGAVMLALGILIDIVFASGAVLRANADKRYSLIGQLARTVPLVLAALLIAHGLSRAFPWP